MVLWCWSDCADAHPIPNATSMVGDRVGSFRSGLGDVDAGWGEGGGCFGLRWDGPWAWLRPLSWVSPRSNWCFIFYSQDMKSHMTSPPSISREETNVRQVSFSDFKNSVGHIIRDCTQHNQKNYVCPQRRLSLGICPVWTVFDVLMKKPWVLSYPLRAQYRLWSAWVNAQTNLSLRWAHRSFCWFCCAQTQLNIGTYKSKLNSAVRDQTSH